MRQLNGPKDLVGLGWRTDLAASIYTHLDEIDVVEVIIDDYLHAPQSKLRSLKMLSQQVRVIYHGVGLGLASSLPVDEKRLTRLARALESLSPNIWSEHLAFVRAGEIEIGHLSAPPRTLATIEGTLKNLTRIKAVVGSMPVLENIATLIDPPGSHMPEADWTNRILEQCNGHLLLDLHNLYANAVNFGFDPMTYMQQFPLQRVRLVHLSGGRWIKEPQQYRSRPNSQRLLDDHVHDVPDVVYNMLGALALATSQPLTVIIERDGEYPAFDAIMQQIRRAKQVLATARNKNMKTNPFHYVGTEYERTVI